MMITNKLKLDLQKPGTIPTIHAVQNDNYSRNLEITLYADRLPFAFPETGRVLIRYKKSDGKGGEYDTLPDGQSAWRANRNVLTIALAPQVLTTPGSVLLSTTLLDGETQLSVFPIRIAVEPIAAAKLAASDNYFYVTGLLPAPDTAAVGQGLRVRAVNEYGHITALEAADILTPQKGIDYWTIADREQIVQDVIAALGLPVFGRVDAENNIILTGALADGTYTIAYEQEDGSRITIGTMDYQSGQEPDGAYTNQIPISTSADGTIYNQVGYAENMRISSSGAPSAYDGICCTGFIPARVNDTLYLRNVTLNNGTVMYVTTRIVGYDENKNVLSYMGIRGFFNNYNDFNSASSALARGDVTSLVIGRPFDGFTDLSDTEIAAWNSILNDIRYIRIAIEHIDAESIITVNEEITA